MRKLIAVLEALRVFLLLVMGVQVALGVLDVLLPDRVEPLLVEDELALVGGGVLVHLGHRQRVDRAGLDAIAAKDALGDVDVELGRVPGQGEFRIFGAHHLDAAGRTGHLAEVAAHAALRAVVVAQEPQRATMGVRDRPLLPRVLEGDRLDEHVLEHDAHRPSDLGEREGVPRLKQQALLFGLRTHDGSFPYQALVIATWVNLNAGTPVVGSTTHSAKSFTGGSLKCSGKKHVPRATSPFGSVPASTEPPCAAARTHSWAPSCSCAGSSRLVCRLTSLG